MALFDKKIRRIVDEALQSQDAQLEETLKTRIYKYDQNIEFSSLENNAWFDGVESLLSLYKNKNNPNEIIGNNNFYNYVDTSEMTPIHSGIPRMLAKTVGTILFHNGINVDGEYQRELTRIAKKAAIVSAYSGDIAIKINLDGSHKVYDKTQIDYDDDYEEIQFISTFVHKKEIYKLYECRGYGYIQNLLFKVSSGKLTNVELSETPQTKDLVGRVNLSDSTLRLAVYLKADSIFESNKTLFATIDEALSNMNDLNRQSKPYTYFTETHTEIDGNRHRYFNARKRRFGLVASSMKEANDGKIQFDYPEYDVNNNTIQIDKAMQLIIQNTSISEATLGKQTSGQISYKTRKADEASTIRLREELLVDWYPFIEELHYITQKAIAMDKGTIFDNSKEYNIEILPYLIDEPTLDTETIIEYYDKALITNEEARFLLGIENILKEKGYTAPIDVIEEQEQEDLKME